jgi:hypothetical protein
MPEEEIFGGIISGFLGRRRGRGGGRSELLG